MPSGPERALIRERLRRRRDALLLELGALVYELHRQGRRAPELLQRKAAELGELDAELAGLDAEPTGGDAGATGEAPQSDDEPVGHDAGATGGAPSTADAPRARDGREPAAGACPACGAPVEPGQLVCLECGSRLQLGRRPRSILPVLATVTAVIVVGAGAFGFALSEITSGDEDGGRAVAAREERPSTGQTRTLPSTAPTETAPRAKGRARPGGRGAEPKAGAAPGTAQKPSQSLLLEWPADLTAHTVVLVTTSDRAAALRIARATARSGIEAGLLRSDDYNLGTGLWIVFAGRFDTRRGAARQAVDLRDRYPGAYPQLIRPAG